MIDVFVRFGSRLFQNARVAAHEVTNVGNDRGQLPMMAEQARAATGITELTVVADRGYFSGDEILACDQAGITPFVPKPLNSSSKAEGRFGKPDFIYIASDDEYRCPAGQRLIKRFTTVEAGMTLDIYSSSACPRCPTKAQCTTGSERRVRRWVREAVIDAMQERLDRRSRKDAGTAADRRAPVRHDQVLDGCNALLDEDAGAHVLAYNLKRVMRLLGIGGLIAAMMA